MSLRIILFWLLSIALLLLCLLLKWDSSAEHKVQPINLLTMMKVKPGLMFRTPEGMNLSVLGQLKLPIETGSRRLDLSQYDTLVLTDLNTENHTDISLNWLAGGEPHQVELMRAKTSITPIDFKTTAGESPTDLHLLIGINNELGNQAPLKTTVTFEQIQLLQNEDVKPMTALLSQWSQFTPIQTSSLNAFNTDHNLPNKPLIFKLSVWVVLVLLLYLLMRVPGKHLVACLALAWLIPASGLIVNQWHQHQQLATAYKNKQPHINKQDQEIVNLADHIGKAIESSASAHTSDKVILMGNGNYHSLRLWHHLTAFNVALSPNLKTLVDRPESRGMRVLLTDKFFRFCQNHQLYDWLNGHLEIIDSNQDFCLARLL